MSDELLTTLPPDRLLTDAEAAELLNVKPSWVGEAARQGRIPCVMLGRYRRFRREVLLAWLEEQEAGGAQPRRRRPLEGSGRRAER